MIEKSGRIFDLLIIPVKLQILNHDNGKKQFPKHLYDEIKMMGDANFLQSRNANHIESGGGVLREKINV